MVDENGTEDCLPENDCVTYESWSVGVKMSG